MTDEKLRAGVEALLTTGHFGRMKRKGRLTRDETEVARVLRTLLDADPGPDTGQVDQAEALSQSRTVGGDPGVLVITRHATEPIEVYDAYCFPTSPAPAGLVAELRAEVESLAEVGTGAAEPDSHQEGMRDAAAHMAGTFGDILDRYDGPEVPAWAGAAEEPTPLLCASAPAAVVAALVGPDAIAGPLRTVVLGPYFHRWGVVVPWEIEAAHEYPTVRVDGKRVTVAACVVDSDEVTVFQSDDSGQTWRSETVRIVDAEEVP